MAFQRFRWPLLTSRKYPYSDQASSERRRSRRPGFSNSLFPSWDSCFVSQKFDHQSQRPWTKTRTSATTLGTGTRASKIQDGVDVDVSRSPAQDPGELVFGLLEPESVPKEFLESWIKFYFCALGWSVVLYWDDFEGFVYNFWFWNMSFRQSVPT